MGGGGGVGDALTRMTRIVRLLTVGSQLFAIACRFAQKPQHVPSNAFTAINAIDAYNGEVLCGERVKAKLQGKGGKCLRKMKEFLVSINKIVANWLKGNDRLLIFGSPFCLLC